MTPVEDNQSSPCPTDRHLYHDTSSSFGQSGNFANSTSLQEAADGGGDRRNESSVIQGDDSGLCFSKSQSAIIASAPNLQAALPAARRSPDVTSLNSSSSSSGGKGTEEEDAIALAAPPSPKPKKPEKKKEPRPACKAKSPVSVSSAESESGFSSISSFQEVGLPSAATITPVKGCHTEVGLPEVPMDKSRHRRWTSTPAELQALYKLLYGQHHRGSFGGSPQAATESISVCWV